MRKASSVESGATTTCTGAVRQRRFGRRAGVSPLPRPSDTACDHTGIGERRLALAVLTEAVRCFQENALARDRHSQDLFREAEQWLMGQEPHPQGFSFEEICYALKLDPNYLRNGLLRWREGCQRVAAGDAPRAQ